MANSYKRLQDISSSHLNNFQPRQVFQQQYAPNYQVFTPQTFQNPTPTPPPNTTPIPMVIENFSKKEEDSGNEPIQLNISFKEEGIYPISSPQIFGPPLWFSLHNGAAHYPINPSPIARMQMKNIILGLPVLIPCKNCQNHATSHIEKYYDQLDDICSSRDKLFKFFVDFHNHVNKRYNKPVMSYEDAYKLYMGEVKFSPFNYSQK